MFAWSTTVCVQQSVYVSGQWRCSQLESVGSPSPWLHHHGSPPTCHHWAEGNTTPQLGIMGAWWGVRQYQVASKLLKESKTPLTIPLINGHPFPDWGGGGGRGGSSTVWLLSTLNVFKPHPYYIIVKSYITSKWKYLYRAHACNLWWFTFLFRMRVPLRVYSVTWTLAAGLYWI